MDSLVSENQLIAGVMSGTSLDGLDIAFCRFVAQGPQVGFELVYAETVPYDQEQKAQLSGAFHLDGSALIKLHADFGKFIGETVMRVGEENGCFPDLISSHGHTVFHRPDLGYTYQMGSGASIAAVSGVDTVCDFRTTDVALGGQGAPLVPIGDQLLFGGHRFCLNLGGIANISYEEGGEIIAFDICPANMALNLLANQAGLDFDNKGELAMSGQLNNQLLDKLNGLDLYKTKGPVSLGREWFEEQFMPLILQNEIPLPDRLRTISEHIALRISSVLFDSPGTTMLTTGGGAFNDFLVETIEEKVSSHGIHVVVPDAEIVAFKEAIVFALLGWLRTQEDVNTLASVTGAKNNSIGGCVYLGA
ncbi:MAG: anhydro-N-acetylmuramic acid kinase [Bacteroidota bacterium]|jgi:anhydro-N-acetylmuramic acid kinase